MVVEIVPEPIVCITAATLLSFILSFFLEKEEASEETEELRENDGEMGEHSTKDFSEKDDDAMDRTQRKKRAIIQSVDVKTAASFM